ncbi:MAG TPA: ActS/PrrB/RegB family redox-sensitive histidine kinase [Xanthobacteraceae bacterium]|nr:ActS/PrrB/RegB family redox-sensitive histidine kinase [Xanthobacteraceae bacterium]
MEGLLLDQPRHLQRNVRLDTLMRLRWLSVLGQTAAILVVHYGLGYRLPVYACLAVVALSACLNVAMRVGFRLTLRLEADRAAWLLAFDIAQLAVLLFLTGGLQNPFAFLFLGPVLISATALPPRMTLMLGTFAVFCASVLFFVHYPLPWDPEDPLELPAIYMLGVWLSILISMGFIGVYAWQITEEARLLANALAATELVLAREQHLSQLDGLAAAAAHELGTPLATITVIAKELERSISENSRHGEDVRLLREQAQRCREILAKITELPASGEPFGGMKLSGLLEEVVAPHRDFGIALNITLPSDRTLEPTGARNPAIIYGLGNLVENAVDFARSSVEVTANWDEEEVVITIRDDGPGFAPEILDRLGEPYVTTRRHRFTEDSEETGLGLGFFIAKTLLERSGATLNFSNHRSLHVGAEVTMLWARSDFEYQASHLERPEPFLWYDQQEEPSETPEESKTQAKAGTP